jgi:DHA2 family multidrug resistance protein
MIPTVFAAAFAIFPPEKRPIVSPIIGVVATLAPTVGPTIGGYLTDLFSWHWLFLINIVPGILVTVSTHLLIDLDESDLSLFKTFDWWGLGFMAAFLGCLEFTLEEGPTNDWPQDEAVLISAIVYIAGGIAFFWRSFTARHPLVELKAFANRNFAVGCDFSFVMGIGLYGLTYCCWRGSCSWSG